MGVDVMVMPACFAHLSMILMLASMIGWPLWQMLSVSAAAGGGGRAPKASVQAQAPASAQPPIRPRVVVLAFLPRWAGAEAGRRQASIAPDSVAGAIIVR